MKTLLAIAAILTMATTASAQNFQDRVTDFIESAEAAAAGLDGAEVRILDAFKQAQDEEGAQAQLEALEAQMQMAASTYGEESEIWVKHTALVEFVEKRRENAIDKLGATGDDRWQKQITRWEKTGEGLQKVRLDIISEADRAESLSQAFSGEMEIILDIYLVEGAEAALAELEGVKNNLTKLNDNVEGALATARAEIATPVSSN